MQNRYDRERNYGDDGHRRDDDMTWEGRDRSRDEGRSWSGGAERDFRRTEGYGQYSRGDRYGDDRERSSAEQYGYGAQRGYRGRSDRDGGDRLGQASRSGEFGQDYGYTRAYGRDVGLNRDRGDSSRAYPDHGYAPGAQIWEGQSRAFGQRDYEPDYLHWREQQMSKFDRDYDDWRSERRQKFSSDFDTWRSTRGNAIVENVSDGGTGSQKDVKNS
ncbi:hypothetical protein ACO2Q1_02390 [Brevundimonas sp. VNH65]|uniref:hypothetical protein n=1 Tax=Brevundimonas sp. VNH65 TaxID=3400917 RepID=UPI003C08585B